LHNNTPPSQNHAIKTWDGYLPVAKIVIISNNPGAETCDKSIAERKGWAVQQW